LIGVKQNNIPQTKIDQIEIYSHANNCGDGEATRTVGFVRQKIQEFQRQGNGRSPSRDTHKAIYEKSR
jgi:hypothetical protein